FEPLGVRDVKWSTSPGGVHTGWGELWLKPRDMAKIGLLYLNKGTWGDKRIVSEKWVETSISPHAPANIFDQYGYQLWIDSSGFFTAVGHKGQFIFVAPDKNLVAVFTSHLEGRDFYIPKELLLSHILPAAVSEAPLAPAPENLKRLNGLAAAYAKGPEDGFTWKSKEEGAAKDGKFVRSASPAFRFEYPPGSIRIPASNPRQVMVMSTIRGVYFDANVSEIPAGAQLSEINAKVYAANLENIGTDVSVKSNRSITLKDGTPAYRSEITWLFTGLFPTSTVVTSVFKEGKWVFVAAHPWTALEEIAPILESPRFD
ncbi:MAG: serine hydrolase, partial [Desulfobacterales bacterium]|nr:serine hydrolase [Desulfobacterales bacterium]